MPPLRAMTSVSSNLVLISEPSAHVAEIVLNRSEALNAMSVAMAEAIEEAVVAAVALNPSVLVVSSACDKAFSVGGDLKERARMTAQDLLDCRPQVLAAFSTGGQWDSRDAEHASAYRSMLTYAGTWERIGDEVVHHVELSLYPAWTGSDQRRRYEFRDDGTLALTARFEDGSREARTAFLEWRRERLQQ